MQLRKVAQSILITSITLVGLINNIDMQNVINAKEIKEENIKIENLLTFKLDKVYEIMNKNYQKQLAKEKLEEEKRLAEEKKRLEEERLRLENSKEYWTFEVSFFCSCYYCTQNGNGITASGEYATEGITIAAPSDIPFGSEVYIEELENIYTVQDRGGYISYDGNVMRLDVFVSDHNRAVEMGRFNSQGYLIRK